MIKLEAEFKIVTPLFMSGADRESAELRSASIRGELRFWWRALSLGRYGSWQSVRTNELALFGSSTGGQSRVHLSMSNVHPSEKRCKAGDLLKDGSGNVVGPGGRYLGYGVLDITGTASRPYIKAPLTGHLTLHLRAQHNKSSSDLEDEADLLGDALKAMGLLGGLGSRSRRGFGSFNLVGLKRDGKSLYSAPQNTESYISKIQGLFEKWINAVPKRGIGIPDYTAFSQDTRAYLLATGTDPIQLLDKIGQDMQMYRSWGHDGMVNDKPSEKNFKNDHDNMKDALSSQAKDYPLRVAFGLPHNYHFSRSNRDLRVLPENHERRASPLFLHIHEISNNEYVALASIFPSKFLPGNESILIRPDVGEEQHFTLRRDWHRVLTDFVEGYMNNGRGPKRFPNLRPIWPAVLPESRKLEVTV